VLDYIDSADGRYKTRDQNGVISTFANMGLDEQNILYNGGFYVQQRVATASTAIPSVSTTTRAGQVADRWAVTVGNATTPSWAQIDSIAAPETNLLARYYGKITQATNAAKFILSQFVIASDMAHLRGKQVRLSVKLKQFAGSNATYRLGLLYLNSSGTVDVCPTFISAIGGASTDPTWGTNLIQITPDAIGLENATVSGVAASITSTANWLRSSCTFTIPSSAQNLCPVLYRDTIGAASDACGIAEFQMTQGTDLVDYIPFPLADEVVRCQRFFNKSFPLTVVPAASLSEATAGSGATGLIGKTTTSALAANYPVTFPVQMWKIPPTVTLFTPTASGAQCWRFSGGAAAAQTATAIRTNSTTDRWFVVTATGDGSGAVGDLVGVHYTADAEFVA
jgi:hypothetical protein